ncbi:restriction endonuclease [Sinomonas halotolerans]|uniref:Restriction endonuclease n=1 Tax=Sinomonas halotolerans TaxID=1644133 RepID=A0ABU9X028_9MICC
MPTMPGSGERWVETLRSALHVLQPGSYNDPQTLVPGEGGGKPQSLAWYANQLAPSGLLERAGGLGIQPTQYALAWLRSEDADTILAMVFHRHVRYIGELMHDLAAGPRTIRELHTSANEHFRLGWQGLDPVRRRVKWLSNLRLVQEVYDRTNSFSLTAEGQRLLEQLAVQDPNTLWPSDDSATAPAELTAAGPVVQGLLDALAADETQHQARKQGVSYVPSRGSDSLLDTLRFLTSLAVPEVTVDDFEATCREHFALKPSSSRSALSTLRAIGLYQPAGRNKLTASDAAREWLESNEDLDLVRILHANIRFVGELLAHVDDFNRAADLHKFAMTEYALEGSNPQSTARTMQILRGAGLLQETGYAQYIASPTGKLLTRELPLAAPKRKREHDLLVQDLEVSSAGNELDQLAALSDELRTASVDSAAPHRFEQAVKEAFSQLGLTAEHIGGSGDTDVLVEVGYGSFFHGKAIVDAKSSASGGVGEKSISFQALREHRAKNAAKYAAVVGPAFPDGRLQQWAIEERVVLLPVERLVTLLQRQAITPLSPQELVRLFEVPDGWDALEQRWSELDRRNQLIKLVVQSLAREAEENDPLLGSALDLISIYRDLRDQIHPRPSPEELQGVLDFLVSPFVAIAIEDKSRYSLRELPMTSGLRLKSLGAVVRTVGDRPVLPSSG